MPAAPFAHLPTTRVRRVRELPLVVATDLRLRGYGCLIEDPAAFPIEIVRWPAQGWRPIDANSGDQGGVAEGRFECQWHGDTLYAHNHPVGDRYLFGWSEWPDEARAEGSPALRTRALIWHANYHPDGGRLIHPLAHQPFVVPLALPGDEVSPEHFTAFYCDGSRGLYLHPGVWHGAFVPLADSAQFLDRQGRVHARVSVDFPREFGCYLGIPVRRPLR